MKKKGFRLKERASFTFDKETINVLEKLLETGDEGIVEWNNWHDNIWGDCICLKCEDIVGTNHLGKLLMRIRTELKEKE